MSCPTKGARTLWPSPCVPVLYPGCPNWAFLPQVPKSFVTLLLKMMVEVQDKLPCRNVLYYNRGQGFHSEQTSVGGGWDFPLQFFLLLDWFKPNICLTSKWHVFFWCKSTSSSCPSLGDCRIDYEWLKVNIFQRSHLQKWFRSLNPTGFVEFLATSSLSTRSRVLRTA